MEKNSGRDPGGKLIVMAMLVWLSVSVGPWWVGLILFLGGLVVNLAVTLCRVVRERAQKGTHPC